MTSVPVPSNQMRPLLPARGSATVKSVTSGDTVILLGRATQMGQKPPEVMFTFEKVSAPRLGNKANGNVDEPGAFTSRMWLRELVVGKTVTFETRKQGAMAGDRVYGVLYVQAGSNGNNGSGEPKMINLAIESVRLGLATPKLFVNSSGAGADGENPADEDDVDPYEQGLTDALREATNKGVGIHSQERALVRNIKNANEGAFNLNDLVKAVQASKNGTVKALIEYVFDGSRYRMQITDESPEYGEFLYGTFTLILGGVMCPRVGNAKAEPPKPDEPLSQEARSFVDLRLLNRELPISLHGSPETMQGTCIGTIHHPRGDISLELLKRGLARVADWSARVLLDAPKGCKSGIMVMRGTEKEAKKSKLGIWKNYVAPAIAGEKSFEGIVVEVSSGDTIFVLPEGTSYASENNLRKLSLSSIRAPRIGNERAGREDDPYAYEAKDRLRVMAVGKKAKITIDYERAIPLSPGETEKRQYATVSVGKRSDLGEVLVGEGLASTQRHRDDEEKSPRYDELCAAENAAKLAKKGIHNAGKYARRRPNDLSEPRKAKTYASSLQRAGNMKAMVEYVFNGSRFKVLIPSENCSCMFALNDVRCPQSTPMTDRDSRKAEPFGDDAKRQSRLMLLQRNVELVATGVTNGGVITGQIFVTVKGERKSYSSILVASGFGHIDQRLVDYGQAPAALVEIQETAKQHKVGLWSLVQEEKVVKEVAPAAKSIEKVVTVKLSEIRDGNHCFFTVDDEAVRVVSESMKIFTSKYGTSGAPCDLRKGKLVAALFDDGAGKSWYRAKVLDRATTKGKVSVLFIDHGNVASVPVASHLRPLDPELDKIAPVAKEAQLALTSALSLDEEDGVDAARLLQSIAWGKVLSARVFCNVDGILQTALYDSSNDKTSINEELVLAGLAKVQKQSEVSALVERMQDGSAVNEFAAELLSAQEEAKKTRRGIWRYGDVGDYDDDDHY